MRLGTLLAGLCLILVLGTAGFHFLEGKSLFDAFYMTAVTITTVGFTDHQPVTTAGRAFTIFILFSGFGIAFTALSQLTAMILRGELQRNLGRRRMEQGIRHMKDHYIVCGMGRVGRVVALEFFERQVSFVMVDKDSESLSGLDRLRPVPYIKGNASDEETLKAAGIQNAKGVVSAVSSDADNAFICMTARSLNPKLHIVTRASEPKSVRKLKFAGADKVVSPYSIAGTRMAQTILNPSLVDFMEIASDRGSADVDMADIEVPPGCPYDGMRLDHAEIKAREKPTAV